MEEGTSSKAIPLRRSRAANRSVSPPSQRWTASITAGARSVLMPPHQLWLAGLGGTALAFRGVRATWTLLVDEGGHVEGWLRRALVIGAGREAPEETSV